MAVTATTGTLLTPAVTLAPDTGSYCAGTQLAFTATPVNGGPGPVYQWKKNGINVGTNAATYTDPFAQNGTVITVEITSNAPCAAPGSFLSNTITEAVTPSVIPGININTFPPHVLCEGSPIQFVTNITAGGANPQYAWYKNGVLLPGATAPTYTDAALQNGDTLQVFLTSSEVCPVTQPTPSNKRGVTVIPVVTPTVSLAVSPGTSGLTIGTSLIFTATHTGGGTNPSFFWKKNGATISAASGTVYNTVQSLAFRRRPGR
jgi:hypothetical protein